MASNKFIAFMMITMVVLLVTPKTEANSCFDSCMHSCMSFSFSTTQSCTPVCNDTCKNSNSFDKNVFSTMLRRRRRTRN
ncbi:hypothetical protein RND81_08G202900 [Saponaria officinalis]|uniref:Plant thionin family protein n=1 Tax=Saponaria officinalis TaxID=3572 RepID=A0AAW1J906_SAPOF